MTQTASFQFRCRRCQRIECGPCTGEPNALSVLISIALQQEHPKMIGGEVRPMSIHTCPDGGHGLTDIIGFGVGQNSISTEEANKDPLLAVSLKYL